MSQIDPFADAPAPNIPRPPAPPPQPSFTAVPNIPADLGEQPDIVPWGPPGSGKTTLLATMIYMLRMRVRNPDENLYYDVYPQGDAAIEFDRQEVANLQAGILPQPTSPGNEAVMRSRMFYIGCRDWRNDGLSGHFHRLLLMDAAGEETNPDLPYDTLYWQRVREARGVLMVINGAERGARIRYRSGLERDYATLITEFLNRAIREDFSYKPYVAVCLTQADRAYRSPEDTYQTLTPRLAHEMNRTQEEPVRRFKELVGESVYKLFKQRLGEHNFQIFITSATGWYRDPHTKEWQQNVVQDSGGWRLRATGDEWWTVGVLYPLMWLFDKVEEARYRESRKDNKKMIRHYLANRVTNQTILKEYVSLPDHHPYWL